MHRPLPSVPLRFAPLALAATSLLQASAHGQSTSFTYQGQLQADLQPAAGVYDLAFRLFDSQTDGIQIGTVQCADNVQVTDGRFAVQLDFGAVFTGARRFVEIMVRPDSGASCGNLSGMTLLQPRQEITPAPMSTYAGSAASAASATVAGNATQLNGRPATYYSSAANLTGVLPSAALSGVYGNALNLSNAGNTFAGSGANITNLAAGNIATGTIADARLPSNIARLNVPNTFASPNSFYAASPQVQLRGGHFGNSLMELAAEGVGAGWYSRIQSRNDHATLGGPDALFLNPDGGNVGIGGYSANAKLEVVGETILSGAAPHALRFLNSTTPVLTMGIANTPGNYSTSALANDAVIRNEFAGGKIHLQNGPDAAALTVDGSNRVGIGTAGPTQKLEVSSTAAFRTARFSNPGSTSADAAGIEIFSASSNKAMNLVMGADGVFYIAQSSQADSGFNTSFRYNSVSGMVSAKSFEIRGGADIAEPFDVCSSKDVPEALPGMVVSIDADHPGKLRLATAPYDRTVAGVISGAGGVAAGIGLRHEGTIADGDHPVALTGRVYCYVDADANGPVVPGDQLTTSNTAGYAMKATDPARTPGAVIGKAMTPLANGRGLVLVLVNLQ